MVPLLGEADGAEDKSDSALEGSVGAGGGLVDCEDGELAAVAAVVGPGGEGLDGAAEVFGAGFLAVVDVAVVLGGF